MTRILDHDHTIGYYVQHDHAIMAFGDGGLGDTSILVARQHDREVERHAITLYHSQEPDVVAWLLATVASDMTADERRQLHRSLMDQLVHAEACVRSIYLHHTTSLAHAGEMAADRLHNMLTYQGQYAMSHTWYDAHHADSTRPSIHTTAYPETQHIEIFDEFEEMSATITYAEAVTMAVGLTVYDRGRLRPEQIKQTYQGLLDDHYK
jgi:hypothetical protein